MATESSQSVSVLNKLPYNKPRKQRLRNKCNQCSDDSKNWTPFRSAEKKYMTMKFPPPDLSEVLDLALLDDERKEEVEKGKWKWKGRADAFETREIELKERGGSRHRRAFCVPMIPGLVILPGYVDEEMQIRLVQWSLSEHARQPNETNLDAHYKIPEEGIWNLHLHSDTRPIPRQMVGSALSPDSPAEGATHSAAPTKSPNQSDKSFVTATKLLHKLRWANIGWFYNWGTKQYEFERGKVDVGEPVRSLCKEIVRSINWKAIFNHERHDLGGHVGEVENSLEWEDWDSSYEPDAGIVNFYQYRDTLMGHVDRAEVCATSPLVSLSLGNAAVFLVGGLTKQERPLAILLRSGDAVVMAGSICRRAYHGVPRILEGTLPQHFAGRERSSSDWVAYSQYLQSTRINVNVRQVFPKNFDPSASVDAHERERSSVAQ